MKSCLPSSIVPETSSERRLPVPPTDSPREAITDGRHGDAQPHVEHEHGDREGAPPRVRYASRAALGPPENAMKITISAGDHERHERDQELHRGRHNTGPASRVVASVGARLGGVRGGAAGALPAAVGGEDVAEAAAACRRRRRAAGSRPSGAAPAASRPPRPPRGSRCRRPPWWTPSPPARLASWAKTPAALPRAPGSAAGVGRARPTPTSSRQCGQRMGSSGQSSPTFLSMRRWQWGQYASAAAPRFLLVARCHPALSHLFAQTGPNQTHRWAAGRKCERFAARYSPSNRKGPSRGPSLSRPVSRILSRAAIHLALAGGASRPCGLPGARRAASTLLLGLAPGGVCLAATSP